MSSFESHPEFSQNNQAVEHSQPMVDLATDGRGFSPRQVGTVDNAAALPEMQLASFSSHSAKKTDVVVDSGTTVHADDGSIITAQDGATVYAGKDCTVNAEAGSTVYAEDGASVYVNGAANVFAKSGCHVYLQDNSSVNATSGPTVHEEDGAKVSVVKDAKGVTAYSGANVTMLGGEITAYDGATIWAKGDYYDNGSEYSHPTVYAAGNCTIYSNRGADIKVQHGANVQLHRWQ